MNIHYFRLPTVASAIANELADSIMSDCTPTLEQLLKSLETLENWFLLGIKLGVPVSHLKKIESLYGPRDSERCKLDMLQYWLDSKLDPKWNEVILALEETDQLALAAQIKHDYLWKDPDASMSPVADNENKVEMSADSAVIRDLKILESSFAQMLVQVKRRIVKSDFSEAQLFFTSLTGSEEFTRCDNFDKLVLLLQRDFISVFNISVLQQFAGCFENLELTEVIEAYNEKKERFLCQTTVHEFQRAVVSRMEPILASGKAALTITILREMVSDRTLKDIEELAMEGFEESQKKMIRVHAKIG